MTVTERRASVEVVLDDKNLGEVSVSVAKPARSRGTAIVAHGAGGTMDTPSLVSFQRALAKASFTCVRFNFLYSQRGKRSPDRQPQLLACWRSVADWVRRELKPKRVFLGGRSMGGRMASYVVAEGCPADKMFFLAYPLHPPGKRDQQRKEHLSKIRVPMLFVSGTRDNFAYLDLLEPTAKRLGAELHLIEGGDHGFKVPKSAGRTKAEINDEVARAVIDFLNR